MNPLRLSCSCLILLIFPVTLWAQTITYSDPDREDARQLRFDVIGKINDLYFVYKNTRYKHYITAYDQDMKVVKNTDLNVLTDRLINVDFIPYDDFAYMIYQYEKKGIVYCMGLRVNGDGSVADNPVQLDTTWVGVFGDNKIYSTVYSEDRSRIMIFKIKGHNTDDLMYTTVLMDNNLHLLHRSRFAFHVDRYRDLLTDFFVDDEGAFVFARCTREATRDNINKVVLCMKPATADSLMVEPMAFSNILLDEVKLKVDNYNQRYILNAFYSGTRRGNIEGLYTAVVDKSGNAVTDTVTFGQDLRNQARGDNSNRTAFNDFFIKHIIVTKDQGYLVTTESDYSSTRGSNWNRYDYEWYNPYSSPYDYYSYYPYNNWGWSPYNRFGYYQPVRYYSDDIALFDFDKDGKLNWSTVVPKSQFDDDEDMTLSFQIMLQGGQLHFLYNEWNRRTPILTDDAVTPDGKVDKQPPFHSLDRGYQFLIRYGKQVSATEMVVPCIYRNSVAFALITFDQA